MAHKIEAEEILPERATRSYKQKPLQKIPIFYNLNSVIVVEGLIRPGGKLRRACHWNMEVDIKSFCQRSLILPIELIIRQTHEAVEHFGINCILNAVISKH